MIIIAETQEGLEFFEVGGLGPGLDSFNLLGVCGDALGGNDVAQVFDRFLEELAFGDLAIEFMLSQEFKDLVKVLLMFEVILTINQDIINVDDHKFIKKRV